MELGITLIILNIGLLVGYMLGSIKSKREQYQRGIYEGAEIVLKLIEKYEKGGLNSALDAETARRLLNERMSKN